MVVIERETKFKETVVNKSKFLSQAIPCDNLNSLKQKLALLWKEPFGNASHIVYALRTKNEHGIDAYFSDDGEPSGTAGKPLLNILEGVAPKGSSALKISGGPAQAWYGSNHLYLRTRLTLISPAWIATMSSTDGMKAYEMPKTPLILGFQDGQSIQLKVEGF